MEVGQDKYNNGVGLNSLPLNHSPFRMVNVSHSGADLGFVEGGASEILPTLHSGVAVAAKIWASKLVVGGGAGPSPPLDPHLGPIMRERRKI